MANTLKSEFSELYERWTGVTSRCGQDLMAVINGLEGNRWNPPSSQQPADSTEWGQRIDFAARGAMKALEELHARMCAVLDRVGKGT
jgi:hypothetical protein